jgi:hypothetical protein
MFAGEEKKKKKKDALAQELQGFLEFLLRIQMYT